VNIGSDRVMHIPLCTGHAGAHCSACKNSVKMTKFLVRKLQKKMYQLFAER
jgi:hypothetical protein